MIGVEIVGTDAIIQQRAEEANAGLMVDPTKGYESLYSHILFKYQENKDHRESNGTNRQLIECLRQFNGEYDPADLAIMNEEGGSKIFMNLTSPKVREASAWIKDILLNEQTDLFSIVPSVIPELPAEITQQITDKITAEFAKDAQGDKESQDVGQILKDTNERKRDLQDAIADELRKESEYEFKRIQLALTDSLSEGKWDDCIDEIIDDFCTFPVACLKGPIVSLETVIKYEKGVPIETKEYKFLNKRISPFDIYPAPEATSPQDGNFIEYMKLSRAEVSALKYSQGYENIDKVLENDTPGYSNLIDTNVDQSRADEEDKDSGYEANKNVFHSLHFFGTAPVKLLRMWGLQKSELDSLEDNDEVEIEAILIGSQVVRCKLKDASLADRPYYTASFRKKPGSFWGTGIPQDMRDVQKMCNAASRALSNNMGMASGPLTEVNVERLADGFQLSELKARDIIQTKDDPTGGSSRAVNFYSAPSNAQELLKVFEFFEAKADEVTMVPRYARQNQQVTGAAATATGLSMLFESGSKGIKNAIRYLDRGIIVPRVQAEFRHLMLKGDHDFTGDVVVIPKGTQSVNIAGAQQIRRNEFLQATSNPLDQQILGVEGRASILRTMSKDLDLGGFVVPSRHELKQKEKLAAQQEQQPSDNVTITQMQLQGQLQMAEMGNQIKQMALVIEKQNNEANQMLKQMELQIKAQGQDKAIAGVLQKTQLETTANAESDDKQVSLSVLNGDKMN